MTNEINGSNQLAEGSSVPKGFFSKNVVGVIVFGVWFFVALIQTTFLPSLVLDTIVGLIVALVVQLVFNGLRKLFEKKQ